MLYKTHADLFDMDVRKEIHIKVMTETHVLLKVRAAQFKITIQDIADELITRFAEGDPYMSDLIKTMVRKKQVDRAIALSNSSADTLLDAIELHDSITRIQREKDKDR